MPFYEYICLQCGNEFEELIRSEQDLNELICPQCDSTKLKKLMSMFGMVAPSGKVVTSAVGGGTACTACSMKSCAGCK